MSTRSSLVKFVVFVVATLLATGTLAATIANTQFGDKSTERVVPGQKRPLVCRLPGHGRRDNVAQCIVGVDRDGPGKVSALPDVPAKQHTADLQS